MYLVSQRSTGAPLDCLHTTQEMAPRAVTNNRFESIQVANRLIDSKLLNQFTEAIHYFYLFNGIVARNCQQIDFYQT